MNGTATAEEREEDIEKEMESALKSAEMATAENEVTKLVEQGKGRERRERQKGEKREERGEKREERGEEREKR
jgi:hypothetical protein